MFNVIGSAAWLLGLGCSNMVCRMRVAFPTAAPLLVAASLAVAVLGCSGSDPADRELPVAGSQSTAEETGAGRELSEPAEPDPSAASEPADPGEDEQLEAAAVAATAATDPAGDSTSVLRAEPIESTPRENVLSALHDPFHPDQPEPLIDLSDIRSVVPHDAIPALEDPPFEPVATVEWLAGVEPVLALEVNGDARAYPLRIMTWHELVNGTVGGMPVTVSYCPLCNSAVAYDRRVGDRILDFGTSGALLNSSLVMYDRQTESLWSHYTGRAVAGHMFGAELDLIPVQTVSFQAFLASHPDGHVLSLDTGHSRQYGQNPYEFYDSNNRPFLFSGPLDDRLEPIAKVIALRDGAEGAVIPNDVLAERRVVPFTFAGRELVALFEPGTASALDSPNIAEGRDVGATGVFVRSVDGRMLELSAADGGGFVDAASGVVYDVLGRPSGPGGTGALEPVEHLDTFWFAAAAFYPDAKIIAQ